LLVFLGVSTAISRNIYGSIDILIAKDYDKFMARYDKLRKLERNRKLIKYYHEHPEMSYKEIGQAFGIDGSRAWRIIQRYDKQSQVKTDGG